MTDQALTPLEDLALEVLVARRRCGEFIWTFEKRHKKALCSLEQKGYANVLHGITEDTIRASLTKKAMDEHMDPAYIPPILQSHRKPGHW